MNSDEVARLVAEAGLVENALEFDRYLTANRYSRMSTERSISPSSGRSKPSCWARFIISSSESSYFFGAERQEKILALYAENKSVREISKQLSMGQGAVKLIIDLYGKKQ